MGKMQLGVVDVSYSQQSGDGTETTTTGQVAEILEAQYHVMETFFITHKGEIAGYIERSFAGAIQDMSNGQPPSGSPTYAAEQQIAAAFRNFLDSNEMGHLAMGNYGIGPAAGSMASSKGVSSRRKAPRAKRAPRPMFVDTGLYRRMFRAIIDVDLSGKKG